MKFIPITIQQNTFSAANLDNKVDDYFAENKDEIYYGNINIQPLLYKDAVIRMSSSVTKARSGNEKMALISNSKQLEMHSSKTVLVSFGSKKQQKKLLKKKLEVILYTLMTLWPRRMLLKIGWEIRCMKGGWKNQ